MPRSVRRVVAASYLTVALAANYILLGSSTRVENPGLFDLPLILIIGLHFVWGVSMLFTATDDRTLTQRTNRWILLGPEILASITLLYFLFAYIFATNANMDYVQRFIASGGNLRLAIDTSVERRLTWLRIGPLAGLDLAVFLLYRLAAYRTVLRTWNDPRRDRDVFITPWALILTLGSAFLSAIAMPSFLSTDGFWWIGWFAMVPLFLVLRNVLTGPAIFYGVTYGVFSTLLSSYWLGTFSLVSLQITVLFFLLYYVIFMPIAMVFYRVTRLGRFLVFPLAWTLLEYLRSIGFLGYPWALAGHSQYSLLPVIQIASLTGVWGVSFVVLLANSAIAELIGALGDRWMRDRQGGAAPEPARLTRAFWATVATVVVIGGVIGFGYFELGRETTGPATTVRVAQVQQNSDPRKHEYEDTFAALIELTDSVLDQDIDLVAWSETAFVPNIRRWSEDASNSRYHRLVRQFLDYQAGIGTWLLTGNDDYEIKEIPGSDETERVEYNAAVLFSPDGERVQTYRKIRLVPFTEHFPYKEQLPLVYNLLLDFDVHFWEKGEEQTVFHHPLFSFSTPICYEDVFPNYVRHFVINGADAILNISNDYWSLTEVQAKQHFVAGMFRAVENRRPILRTTASGLTGQIDPLGRIIQTAPYYEEAVIISDLRIPETPETTIYTRWGDWFPLAAGGALLLIVLLSLLIRRPEVLLPLADADAEEEPDHSEQGDGDFEGDSLEEALDSLEPIEETEPVDDRTPPEGPSAAAPPAQELTSDVRSDTPAESETQSRRPAEEKGRKSRRSRRTNWKAIWDD